MADDLFPCRFRAGRDWDMDADAYDHRQRDPGYPDLVVTDPEEVGRIWHPDGVRFRPVMDRETVPFGFQAAPKE